MSWYWRSPPSSTPWPTRTADPLATYDVLAPHYDAVTGDGEAEAALIRDIVGRRCPPARTLLDVGCGTGGVTVPLARSYQVSGLDIAPGMLAVAREKLPATVPLHLADMSSFELGTRFDAIACAYQGVNHLLSFPAWNGFFACAARHLNPGGVFVFDIATNGYLTTMARTGKVVEEFDGNYLLITVRTTSTASVEWRIEVFELQPNRRYRLVQQTVELRSWPVAMIRAALSRWFTDVEVMGGDGNPTEPGRHDRLWLAGVKPAEVS
jgi:SAM-dependent methyltransferase